MTLRKRLVLQRCRQRHRKDRPLADDALDGDRYPVRLDQRFGNGRSQAELAVGCSELIGSVKALKDMGQILWLDTRPGVAHAERLN